MEADKMSDGLFWFNSEDVLIILKKVTGPLTLDLSYNLNDATQLPLVLDNPYYWSKFMNIIFVDGPAGSGFPFSKTQEGYQTNNLKFADNLNEFIHKWVDSHDRFRSNIIYISGNGFSGRVIPIALYNILQDNEIGIQPHVNMGGYVLISPGTSNDLDLNSRYVYAYNRGLIDDDIWKVAEENCNGNYFNPETDSCKSAMDEVNAIIGNINIEHILEPACGGGASGLRSEINISTTSSSSSAHRYLQEEFINCNPVTIFHSTCNGPACRKYYATIGSAWLNHEGVKEALQVREGTTLDEYQLCNPKVRNEYYNQTAFKNSIPYHELLSNFNIRGLIMSGDHDMSLPNVALKSWISSLNLDLVERWRVWSLHDETAGFTKRYQKGDFSLTYVSVKGGGHFIPQYKPQETYLVAQNWTSYLPL